MLFQLQGQKPELPVFLYPDRKQPETCLQSPPTLHQTFRASNHKLKRSSSSGAFRAQVRVRAQYALRSRLLLHLNNFNLASLFAGPCRTALSVLRSTDLRHCRSPSIRSPAISGGNLKTSSHRIIEANWKRIYSLRTEDYLLRCQVSPDF